VLIQFWTHGAVMSRDEVNELLDRLIKI